MSSEDSTTQTPPPRGWTKRRVFLLILFMIVAWAGVMIYQAQRPSMTLPNRVRMIYHDYSKGEYQPDRPGILWGSPSYHHPIPPQDHPRLQLWWNDLRPHLPPWLTSRLPTWDIHLDNYPHGQISSEIELRFRVVGDFAPNSELWNNLWNVFVADDNGWESQILDAYWCDDGRRDHGATKPSSWLRAGTAIPRHTKHLRVRARLGPRNHFYSPLPFTELKFLNPFYEGPATRKGDALPITMPFRDGTITLKEIHRDKIVGEGYGALTVRYSLDRNGRPLEGFDCQRVEVSDTTGQRFLFLTEKHERDKSDHIATIHNAPWSDDPCWTVRLTFSRRHYCEPLTADQIFRFEKLPVPTDEPVELNRELTQNGVTLRLAALSAKDVGSAFFRIDGWNDNDPFHRLVLVHQVRDDRGRTHLRTLDGNLPFVRGPMRGGRDAPQFSLTLSNDAKWWDLAVIPETMTQVEFNVLPPDVE